MAEQLADINKPSQLEEAKLINVNLT